MTVQIRNPTFLWRLYFWLAMANLAGALLFCILLFVVPIFTNLSMQTNFRQVDEAGAINKVGLKQLQASTDVGDLDSLEYRKTVPEFIAAAPLHAQRTNAMAGLIATAANALVWLALWRSARGDVMAALRPPKEGGIIELGDD